MRSMGPDRENVQQQNIQHSIKTAIDKTSFSWVLLPDQASLLQDWRPAANC